MNEHTDHTTRPLTDEQWEHWQKLVSEEHARQLAEIQRLRNVVERLGSSEAFTAQSTMDPDRDAELLARISFARKAVDGN